MGHTYMPSINQKKAYELASIPGVQLRVVVPEIWKDPLWTLRADSPSMDAPFSYVALPTFFNSNETKYIFRSIDVTIRDFKPDIVQVEEGPFSLSLLQVLLLRKILHQEFKVGFFTWIVNYKSPSPIGRKIAEFCLKEADYGVCGMYEGVDQLRTLGFKKPLFHLAQLGIDQNDFFKQDITSLRQKLGFGADTFVVGFAARMDPEKGLLTLIESASKLQGDWALLLMGEGTQKNEAESFCERLGISDRVRFAGTVPHSEFCPYVNVMDVWVSPSLTTSTWKEQFAWGALTAMSCGVPVIGSSCGEIPYVLGDAGLIFPEGDVSRLIDCLYKIKQDGNIRKILIDRGYKRVNENYTWKRLAEQTCEVWRKLFYSYEK